MDDDEPRIPLIDETDVEINNGLANCGSPPSPSPSPNQNNNAVDSGVSLPLSDAHRLASSPPGSPLHSLETSV